MDFVLCVENQFKKAESRWSRSPARWRRSGRQIQRVACPSSVREVTVQQGRVQLVTSEGKCSCEVASVLRSGSLDLSEVVAKSPLFLLLCDMDRLRGFPDSMSSLIISHVNESTLGCLLGSIKSGQRPTYQLPRDPSGFIVKPAPNPPDSNLKQEPSVKTLWKDARMMVFHMRLISPFSNISTTILVRQAKSPEYRETGRRFALLWEVLVPKLREIFLGGDAKGNFIVTSLDARAPVLSIYDRRNRVGKLVFKLAPPGR